MATDTQNSSKMKLYINVAITLAFMFLFRFIPAPAPITPYGMAIAGIFIGLIYGWSIGQCGMVWTALFALAALACTEYGTASEVMINAFGSDMLVLTIVGMFFVGTLMESGVTEYVINQLCASKLCAGRPWLITAFLVVGCTVLGIFMNTMIIALFMQAIVSDFAKQVGYQKGDLYPTMLLGGIFTCLMCVTCIFPFRGWPLLPLGTMKGALGFGVDFGQWMIVIIPGIFIIALGWVLLMRLMPNCDASLMANVDSEALRKKYPNGMTKYQKGVLIAIFIMVLGSVIISFIGGNSPFIAILKKLSVYGWSMLAIGAYMVIHVEGKPLLSIQSATKYFQWDLIFVMASATVVSGALTSAEAGVSAFVTMLLRPIFATMGEFTFLVFLCFITLILTNFLNNIGVTVTMLAVCFAMYSQGVMANIELAVTLVSMFGLCGVMTPAASVYGAMIHATPICTARSCYINGAVTIIYLTIIAAVILIPLGLFVF